MHIGILFTVPPACAQVCAAMCTILAAVLLRLPDAVLRSKFAPSAAILSALAERHADQVHCLGLSFASLQGATCDRMHAAAGCGFLTCLIPQCSIQKLSRCMIRSVAETQRRHDVKDASVHA